MVTRQSRDPIPADYTWKLDLVPPDEPLMFADKLDYRSAPRTCSSQLQPGAVEQPDDRLPARPRGITLVRDDRVPQARRRSPRRAEAGGSRPARRARADARLHHVARAEGPAARAAAGRRRLDASKHYQAASGEDMTTSVEVRGAARAQGIPMTRLLVCLATATLLAIPGVASYAVAGETIEQIKTRRTLRCGVSDGMPGFSTQDATGRWSGLDVDICRAVAAAALGDPERVTFVPLRASARFRRCAWEPSSCWRATRRGP